MWEKIKFSFIGVIQIARDNGLCEFCTEEGESVMRDVQLEAKGEDRDVICTQLQPCEPDRRNGSLENVISPKSLTSETPDIDNTVFRISTLRLGHRHVWPISKTVSTVGAPCLS